MNRLNPTAVSFWICCSGVGYLLGGVNGAVTGLVISTFFSTFLA